MGLFKHPKRRLRKLVQKGEYAEALKFGKSLEKNSHDPDLYFIIASIYYINGDANNALSYLDKVLDLSEFDTEALIMKANLHIYLKNKNKAVDCCEKLRQADPKNKEIDEILNKIEEI